MFSRQVIAVFLLAMLVTSCLSGEHRRSIHHDGEYDDNFLHAIRDVIHGEGKLQRDERGNLNRGLTAQQQKKVVDIHNRLRRGEGASDMEKLVWNGQLADLAQQWTDRCEFVHRDASPAGTYDAGSYGFGNVGENMWVGFGGSSNIPEQAIQGWFDEKSNYDYSSSYCMRDMCGHYTQVVRATTTAVGCGFTKCATFHQPGQSPRRNAEFFVCNYGPGDNYPDRQPFKLGQPCTECASGKFYCTNNMCDSSCSRRGSGGSCQCRATCHNCGRVTNSCSCQCIPGYSGVTCDQPCEDLDPKCNPRPGQTGWPASFCTYSDASFRQQVIEKCPKMCNKCTPSDGTPCNSPRSLYDMLLNNQ